MKYLFIFWTLLSTTVFAAGDYTVAAHYYPWYGGSDNPHWPNGVAHRPWIGYYSSASPSVVKQQIDLAAEYGVDVFAVSWTGINSASEKKFKAGFLKAPNINKIKFCLLYESVIRLSPSEFAIDFNNPAIREKFISDFVYFGQTYFKHPQYFKINGRPVVNLYVTRVFQGDVPGVIREIRRRLQAAGHNVYLVGDSLFYGRNDLFIMSQMDAVTIYSFFSPATFSEGIDTTGKLARAARPFFWNFADQLREVKTAATGEDIDIQPGVLPQFDARRARNATDVALLAQNKKEVVDIFTVAKEFVDAKAGGGPKVVWITSWNEWHEGTSIEPTVNGGAKYPGGNYGYDFLEAVSEVFQ